MHIINSTAQNKVQIQEGLFMEEKTYKTMGLAGSSNVAIGIVLLVVGIASGVMLIVTGANLLKKRGNLLF